MTPSKPDFISVSNGILPGSTYTEHIKIRADNSLNQGRDLRHGVWVAQSAVGPGHDPWVLGSSPTSGSPLSRKPASPSPIPPVCVPSLTVSLSVK